MREDWQAEAERQKKESLDRIAVLMGQEHLDENGYPTEAALEIIKLWHWDDAKGWFEFIYGLWAYGDWGWSEKDGPHEIWPEKTVHRYHISTAGWSGNEAIIAAMQANSMMWHLNWVQSRRGGHYIFELKEVVE